MRSPAECGEPANLQIRGSLTSFLAPPHPPTHPVGGRGGTRRRRRRLFVFAEYRKMCKFRVFRRWRRRVGRRCCCGWRMCRWRWRWWGAGGRRSVLPCTGCGIECSARTHDSSASLQHPGRSLEPFRCILADRLRAAARAEK